MAMISRRQLLGGMAEEQYEDGGVAKKVRVFKPTLTAMM